ncbi:hypothetical protein QD336_15285 [Rhizobium sp. BR 250]
MTTFRPLVIRVTERDWALEGKRTIFETVKNGRVIATYVPDFASEREPLIRYFKESGHHVEIETLGQIERPRHLRERGDR